MFRMYEWKPNDLDFTTSRSVTTERESEPKVTFATPDNLVVLTMTASGVAYNRDLFSSDSYLQAAKRVFSILEQFIDEPMKQNKHFSIHLKNWRDFPPRDLKLDSTGAITHNYDLDTWHWWLFESLSELIRKKYHI